MHHFERESALNLELNFVSTLKIPNKRGGSPSVGWFKGSFICD
jgi:hypothetical protein